MNTQRELQKIIDRYRRELSQMPPHRHASILGRCEEELQRIVSVREIHPIIELLKSGKEVAR